MRTIIILAVLFFLGACVEAPGESRSAKGGNSQPGTAGNAETLTVWADPILIDPLNSVAVGLKKDHGLSLEFVPKERGEVLSAASDGESELPDLCVFAGADIATALRESGQVEEDTFRTFAGDRLVVVQKRDGIYRVVSLYDIYKLFVNHFALGEDSTLAGYYGNQALVTSGARKRLDAKEMINLHKSTREMVELLEQDGADLAIVTASTAAMSPGIEICRLIDETYHEDIQYVAVAMKGRSGNRGVIDFLRLIAEDEGIQQQLVGFGLLDRASALEQTP